MDADLLVVGDDPAGVIAALLARRAGRSVLLLAADPEIAPPEPLSISPRASGGILAALLDEIAPGFLPPPLPEPAGQVCWSDPVGGGRIDLWPSLERLRGEIAREGGGGLGAKGLPLPLEAWRAKGARFLARARRRWPFPLPPLADPQEEEGEATGRDPSPALSLLLRGGALLLSPLGADPGDDPRALGAALALLTEGGSVVARAQLTEVLLGAARRSGARVERLAPLHHLIPERGGVVLRQEGGDLRGGAAVVAGGGLSALGRLLPPSRRAARSLRRLLSLGDWLEVEERRVEASGEELPVGLRSRIAWVAAEGAGSTLGRLVVEEMGERADLWWRGTVGPAEALAALLPYRSASAHRSPPHGTSGGARFVLARLRGGGAPYRPSMRSRVDRNVAYAGAEIFPAAGGDAYPLAAIEALRGAGLAPRRGEGATPSPGSSAPASS